MRDKIDFQGSKIWVPWGAYCNLGGPNPKFFLYIFPNIPLRGWGKYERMAVGKEIKKWRKKKGRKRREKGKEREWIDNGENRLNHEKKRVFLFLFP